MAASESNWTCRYLSKQSVQRETEPATVLGFHRSAPFLISHVLLKWSKDPMWIFLYTIPLVRWVHTSAVGNSVATKVQYYQWLTLFLHQASVEHPLPPPERDVMSKLHLSSNSHVYIEVGDYIIVTPQKMRAQPQILARVSLNTASLNFTSRLRPAKYFPASDCCVKAR